MWKCWRRWGLWKCWALFGHGPTPTTLSGGSVSHFQQSASGNSHRRSCEARRIICALLNIVPLYFIYSALHLQNPLLTRDSASAHTATARYSKQSASACVAPLRICARSPLLPPPVDACRALRCNLPGYLTAHCSRPFVGLHL